LPGFPKDWTEVRRLSVGAQQLVEIGRALVLDAKLIVFDEPTSSLTQSDARRLFNVIGRLKKSGYGIVYISHFLEEVREMLGHTSIKVTERYAHLRRRTPAEALQRRRKRSGYPRRRRRR
jgi:ABC-type sugar transport system ATPase subunit